MVIWFGESLRYCYERKLWLIWDGRKWKWDAGNLIVNYAIKTVRAIYNEAANANDKESRETISNHAHRSESDSRIEAMISLARALPGIPVAIGELDAHAWLFNVNNGTINLKTGQLQPHSKSDLQTILIPINYKCDALCPLWDKFIYRVTGGKKEVVQYLQRAVGYSLTEDIRQQIFFFLYGTGNNGKSTFIMTIRKILGEYGSKLSIDDLMTRERKVSGAAKEGIADLRGKRFVFASEIAQGNRLSVGLIKDLTGGETVKVRRLYEHEIEYQPTYKLWIYGNHKPVITDTTLSIWRRLKLIPFDVTIPPEEIDHDLQVKLEKELPGILAWAVRGCLDWQTHGLTEATEVKAATASYRHDEDVLADFLEDCCVFDSPTNTYITKAYLKKLYQDWATANGIEPMGQKTFKVRLEEKGVTNGFTPDRKNRAWLGIRAKTASDTFGLNEEHTGQNEQHFEPNGQNGQDLPINPNTKGFSKDSLGKPVGSVQDAQDSVQHSTFTDETEGEKQGKLLKDNNITTSNEFLDKPCPACGMTEPVAYGDSFACGNCHPELMSETLKDVIK